MSIGQLRDHDGDPGTVDTLVHAVRRHAARAPEETALVILDPEGGAVSLTRGELDSRARAVAAAIHGAAAKPGDRVAMVCETTVNFVVAFFGALYAGACAVPILRPPTTNATSARIRRLHRIVTDARPTVVLGDQLDLDNLRSAWSAVDVAEPVWLPIPDTAPDGDAAVADPSPDDLAFLQYTSGSTADPKGVMVTHANLVANLRAFTERLGITADHVYVNWAPLFHDMGLIGCLLTPQYLGAGCVLMRAQTFAERPMRWLDEVSRAGRPVVSFAPNFALDLCVDRTAPDDRGDLDLSRWDRLILGAEPISMRTMRRFTETFTVHGLRPAALTPGYGLAETTLVATVTPAGGPTGLTADAASAELGQYAPANGGRSREITSCGSPLPGAAVVIVDEANGERLPEDRIGDIWLSGDSVAAGYWNRAEPSENTFGAELVDGTGPFLRTGDRGFLHDGLLFLTGRSKDLIIIRGRNVHAADAVEIASTADPACHTGLGAAFAIDDHGEERLVVVQAVRVRPGTDLPAVSDRVRRAIMEDLEIEPYDVVLVRSAGIPRTTSGKIQHAVARQDYLAGRLPALARTRGTAADGDDLDRDALTALPEAARRGAVEAWLREQVARAASVPTWRLDPLAPLTGYGLDSLRTLSLRSLVETRLHLSLPASVTTLGQMTDAVMRLLDSPPADTRSAVVLRPDPGAAHEPFPLTEVQHAYLLGRSDSFVLGGVATHGYLEIDADDLDLPRLESAWQAVVDRHAMLRTVILADGTQRVCENLPAQRIRVGEDPDTIRDLLSAEIRPAGEWPLWDVHASRLPGGGTRLHLSVDLLIADLWSIRLVLRDWAAYYRGDDPGPEGPAFRDCVLAQRATSGHFHDYWRARAEALPAAPDLPLAVAPGELGRPEFTRRAHRLPAGLWAAVKASAAAHGVTPSGALLAAYSAVLGRWSARQHFTLNVTLFNRPPIPGVERTVGDFTAVEPLEVDLRGLGDLRTLAEAVQNRLWEDLAHGPAGALAALGEVRRSVADPLLPVVFTSGIGFAAADEPFVPPVLGRLGHTISQTPQVYLDHQATEDGGDLLLAWDAVEELFPAGVLDDMFEAYTALVEVLAEPQAWSGWPVRLPVYQAAVMAAVNATAGPVPGGLLGGEVFARAAERPDAPAVFSHGRWHSYAEITGRALALAAVTGVTPGEVVAVGAAKGWRQVVAVLAVTAAGGVYVPIDPGLPPERRRGLIGHSGATCVLTDPGGDDDWGVPVHVVAEQGPVTRADLTYTPRAVPADVAYIIYTSGSTGTPKGVAVSHRAALNTLHDVSTRYGVTAGDRVLGISSLSFDLSVYDVFGILGAGAGLVLPDSEHLRDPQHWTALIVEQRVTVWNSVPALAQMLTEHAAATDGRLPLRIVLLSGDWIPTSLPDRIRAIAPLSEVISLGGATEAAVWSIAHPIDRVEPGWTSVPYGKPLTNQTFAVTNQRGEPCPIWVPGELVIGGAGVAEGYWNDPERTAHSFPRTPTGQREYRTGDLGRYRPDGSIEFLGREDFQVKIGGYRIELGEIEQTLLTVPQVGEAVVTAVGERGQQRLVAYVTAAAQSEVYTSADDVEHDPRRRLAFTLARHGVRRIDGPGVDLTGDPPPRTRRSIRAYLDDPVPLDRLAALLTAVRSRPGTAEQPLTTYDYASAGGLYPVQAYLWIRPGRVDGVPGGAYYHHPEQNRLIRCGEADDTTVAAVFSGVNAALYDACAFVLVAAVDHAAVDPLYGKLSRDFALLETGAMMQALETSATAAGLGLCQVGDVAAAPVLRDAFRLGTGHEPLHVVVGGIPDPAPAADVLTGRIRRQLQLRLPSYMVPASIRLLPRLPLTSQGKVDRKALAMLGAETAPRTHPYVPPATALERDIVQVVAEVLDVAEIGAADNFFDLGANSLRVTQIYNRLRVSLGLDFPLLLIFETANARALAARLSSGDGDDGGVAARAGRERGARRRAARVRRDDH
ncbi:non-ribosomal peptide synthetase [Micromonospora craniellae]|nr:non-ribosomal peptide synthetase [Micromonospora craniellae]